MLGRDLEDVGNSRLAVAVATARPGEGEQAMVFGRKKDEDDRRAFESEALPHMQTLLNAALYMTRNPAGAEDLVQETLLKAYRFWHRYERCLLYTSDAADE